MHLCPTDCLPALVLSCLIRRVVRPQAEPPSALLSMGLLLVAAAQLCFSLMNVTIELLNRSSTVPVTTLQVSPSLSSSEAREDETRELGAIRPDKQSIYRQTVRLGSKPASVHIQARTKTRLGRTLPPP